MELFFAQTAEHNIRKVCYADCLKKLPEVIRKYTGFGYSYNQTNNGCFLSPTYLNGNYFVPEIDILVSSDDAQTVLHMRGRPAKSIRIFLAFWFGFLLLMQMLLLGVAITIELYTFFIFFAPIVMAVFGYLIFKIATKKTFESVVKAIKKEFQ